MSEEKNIRKSIVVYPFLWGGLILVIAQALTLYVAFLEKAYLEANQIALPKISIGLPLAYFFGTVLLLGLILFLVPVSKLKIILKIMFAFLFSWGTFMALWFALPVRAAAPISIAAGLFWFFRPRVWFHNLLLVLTLVSSGAVFGYLLSPWTAASLMLVLSVYDVLAVRFGYMVWLAKRLSQTESLPAFFIPKKLSDWNIVLREAGFKKFSEDKPAAVEFSIMGGGDIGLPLLLIVSVFFASGLSSALVVSAFSLVGLISAFLIQLLFLKGKPMPALPPITFLSLVGLFIAQMLG